MSEPIFMPDRIVRRAVSELVPYARNSRQHSDEQVKQLADGMREFGYTNPILTADDGILAGHGRVMALQLLGQEWAPTIDLSHLTEAQRRAYVIADNKLALNASWDLGMLKLELAELDRENFDLLLTGFSQDELDELFEPEPDPNAADPDAIPEPPAEPVNKLGDVWICGPHRVMCGDSLSVTYWDQLMGRELADMVWTDPPYNVAIGKKNAEMDKYDGMNRSGSGGIKNDQMSDEKFREFLTEAFVSVYTVMKPGAAIYVAHPDREAHNFHSTFRAAGFKFSGCVIWRKNIMVLGRTDYQNIHEPILYGWKPGGAHRWFGGRKQTTVNNAGSGSPFVQQEDGRWLVHVGDETLVVDGAAKIETVPGSIVFHAKPSRSEKHPTTKPVGLIAAQLRNNARPNDIIVDAFGGSGSTMIAAEMERMCARIMELDPKFADVICQRYYEFTGRVPLHAVTGEPFPVQLPEEAPK